MKTCFARVVLLLLCAVCALQVQAQQNLFNSPSGSMTPKGKFFYQHQLNIYNPNKLASKQHFVYGLGSNWEIGMNLLNVNIKPGVRNAPLFDLNYNDRTESLGPIVAITGQKLFQLSKHWQTSIGTQVGLNLVTNGTAPQPTHYTYSLLIWQPKYHWRFVGGVYQSDWRLIGPGNSRGIMLGYEVPLSKNFYLMGDFISGDRKSVV